MNDKKQEPEKFSKTLKTVTLPGGKSTDKPFPQEKD